MKFQRFWLRDLARKLVFICSAWVLSLAEYKKIKRLTERKVKLLEASPKFLKFYSVIFVSVCKINAVFSFDFACTMLPFLL